MTDNQLKAKRYLIQLSKYPENIEMEKYEVKRIQHMITGIKALTYDRDVVQVSPADKLSEDIVRLIELEEKLSADIKKYAADYAEAFVIMDMMDADEKKMLQLHYFQDKTYIEITRILHISERTAKRINDAALEHFGEKM